MPTFDSEHMAQAAGTPNKPHVSVSRDGKLLPEVLQVLDLIAKHNLTLATGHSSPTEDLMLVREAGRHVKQLSSPINTRDGRDDGGAGARSRTDEAFRVHQQFDG
jgi:hypothetical protein